MTGASAVRRPRVRPAGASDLAAIQSLLLALGYNHPDGDHLAGMLRRVLLRPDLGLYLASAPGGEPLGLILLSQRPQLHLGGVLVSIDALVVAPEARGLGVGRRLLRRARAFARMHHAMRIEVHTSRVRENYQRGFYPANSFDEADSALFRLATLETGRSGRPRLADDADAALAAQLELALAASYFAEWA